ncbi:MAG: hypothetical protein LUD69_06865 [Oscillospiraceae bacterium]|nr:hypothetical protein [Oscillospiraceae bacterium]
MAKDFVAEKGAKAQEYCSPPSPGQHSCPAYAANVPPAHLLDAAVSSFCNAFLRQKILSDAADIVFRGSLKMGHFII